MDHSTGTCTTPDGVTIAYAISGSGAPMVIVSSRRDALDPDRAHQPPSHLIEALSRSGRLIRFRRRSEVPRDGPAGDLSDQWLVSDLAAVAEAFELETFALIGLSGAAPAAIEYAARHPDRIDRLVLIGASASSRGQPESDTATTGLGVDGWLHAVRAPTLVVHSSGDPLTSIEQAEAMAGGIPGARLVALDSRQHIVSEHEPAWQVLRRELEAFLSPRAAAETSARTSQDDLSGFLVTGGAARASMFSELAVDLGLTGGEPAGGSTHETDDPLIGTTIGRYRVTGRIGVGGMGVVYRALDTRLSRPVAIKLLQTDRTGDPRALERFEREARAVSALNHPNICVLHEVGEHGGRPFLVLELLEGRTLDRLLTGGAVPPVRALEIAAAVSDGLEAAHEAGILHRDVKPANVFITRRGHVKILDFGIAKLMSPPPETDAALAAQVEGLSLTRPGTTVGTFAFMSPEQIRGEELDGRTDIFSLGAVLYEMLAGRRAFAGQTAGAIIDTILREQPPPLTDEGLDARLQALVSRALAKDRALRWPNAGELRDALEELRLALISGSQTGQTSPPARQPGRVRRRWFAAAVGLVVIAAAAAALLLGRRSSVTAPLPVATTTAVAVLPFEDLTADPVDRYLALSVPDEVTNVLARAHELSVRPFSETRRVDLRSADPRSVGQRLGADHLVTGQLFLHEGRLRLTLEAIDAAAERVVWRETLSLPADDLTAMRRELSDRVRAELLPALGVSALGEPGSHPASSEAYRLYLVTLPMLNDPQPNAAAIAQLERSVGLDPDFAPAWSELGKRRYIDAFYWGGGEVQLEKARAAVGRALELDPDLLEAAGTYIDLRVADGAVVEAYAVARGIVDHRPQSAYAHSMMAVVLRYGGLLDEAVAACDLGFALDPRDPRLRSCTWPHLWRGEYDQAAAYASRASSLLWQNDLMARIALMEGRDEDARRLWSRQVDPSAGELRRDTMVACLDGVQDAETALRFGEDFDDVVAIRDPEWTFASAGLFARCGFHDLAIDLLRRAAEGGYCVDPSPEVDPLLAPLAGSRELAEISRIAEACRDRVRRTIRGLAAGSS